jgi:hypothetical protein
MKKTVEELTQEDFEIGGDHYDFYIHTAKLQNFPYGAYLHRDGNVERACGLANFFATRKEAQECLDKYFPIKSKEMTIGEQIKFAKSLIGKRIKHRNDCSASIIDGYEVITELDHNLRAYPYFVKDSEEIFSKQDVLVYIYSNNSRFKRAILPKSTESDFKIVENGVKVNGYVGNDTGDYYEFGCVEISKHILRDAKEFLSTQSKKPSAGNRKIQSVKIGAGDFTLEILEKMNL